MRKLLLATAATAGVTFALTGGALAQPVKPVAAGTLLVHINGYLQFEFAGTGSTDNRVNTVLGAYKLNPITTDGDARLYGGFDGKTRTGLDYGAQIELRTTTSDANVGAGKNTGTTAAAAAGTETLYIKRAYGYIGTVDAGYVRLGQGDSAFSLLQTGVVEAFGDGAQFNTDGGESSLLPTDASPSNFIYADQSNLYATDKIVYLTPAIAGLSAGFSYEPNSNGLKEGYGNNPGAGSTSGDLAASATAADIGKRRKNTIDAAIQYVLKYNGFAIKTSAGILYGAPIAYDGPAVAAATATTSSALHFGYDDLEVYELGAQVTYAGVTLAGNIKGGQTLDSYAFKPKGTRDAFTYIVSLSYVLGPYVFGGSFFDAQTAGAYVPGATYLNGVTAASRSPVSHTLSEYGIATGVNYVISPHLSLFAQYEYGHRHQPGNTALDISGVTGTAAVTARSLGVDAAKGDAQVQAIAGGVTFKW